MAATPLQGVRLDTQVREEIYRQLRSRGLPEWLKTQFRSKLVHELQAPPPPPASVEQERADPLCQLANDLILEHLRSLKYHCSRSVFTAEYTDKALSVDHLLTVLRVPVESSLAQMVKEPKTSVLVVLLLELANHFARRSSSREAASQTDSDPSSWSSLLVKLSQLDRESSATLLSSGSGQQSVEEQLAAHQHRCEEWAREQVKREVARIHKVELAQMKMAERERHDRELASIRDQLHTEYSERLKHLKSIELKLHEQFRNKEQELESSVFMQRQTLLKEMDSMKNREAISLRSAAVSRETLSSEAARVECLLEEVRGREASLEQVRLQYQRLAEETTQQLEQRVREEALQHQKELRRRELALKEVQGEVERLKDCLHESQAECSSLQGRLSAVTEQQSGLARQYDSLQKRLACLGDSPEASMQKLQQQVEMLRAQLKCAEQHSQQREKELKKSLEETSAQLSTRPAELGLLEAELQRERQGHREQVGSLTRERDCLQRAVVILKRRSNDSEHRLQEKGMLLLHCTQELEDAKAQVAVLEQAVDGLVRRGAPSSQGKKGQGSSPVGKKVLRFASPVQTRVFPPFATTSPKRDLHKQVHNAPPRSELDTRSIILRLDQVAKEVDASYCRMIDTSSAASESDHLPLLSPGSPLTPNTEQSAVKEQVQLQSNNPVSECGAQLVDVAAKTVLEDPGFQGQEQEVLKWPLSLDTLWQYQHQRHHTNENTSLTLDSAPPTSTTDPALPTSTTELAPPTSTTELAPPTHTTDPAPPTHTTELAPPISATDPAPPTHTTELAPPTSTTDPAPPISATDPAPPTHTTELAPPISATDPAPPTHTTDPAPPTSTTDPAPPISTTDPAPPTHTTDPAPPISTTDPAPPTHTTDSAPPTHTSDSAPPTHTTDPAPPTHTTDPAPPIGVSNLTALTWEARHREREQERQRRRMDQEAECQAQLTELGQENNAGDGTTPSPGAEWGAPSKETDSVMQRYLQMVMEQKQEGAPASHEINGHDKVKVDEFGLPLSAVEHGSFGGASSDDNPFEDW